MNNDIKVEIISPDQLDEPIDLVAVHWIAGERTLSNAQVVWSQQLKKERGDRFYSDVIFAMTNKRYPYLKANELWQAFLLHRDELTDKLGRNPGIIVAALDYLSNQQNETFKLIENQQIQNCLVHSALDGLTGLYDRNTTLTLLEKEIERSIRHDEIVSLMKIDIDDFTSFNERFGSQMADEVLAKLSSIIHNIIRSIDFAGRYDGNEFLVILPETEKSLAMTIAERLRKTVAEIFLEDAMPITISIGISSLTSDLSVDGLIIIADDALHKAKKEGKNRVR